MSYFPSKNTFQSPRACSQFGEACARDSDCLRSCPFGEVPEERMTCVGSPYSKARNMGQCQAMFASAGDPCIVGQYPTLDTCAPDTSGGDSLYCEQSLAAASPYFYNQQGNQPPTFARADVGEGWCMPKRRVDAPPVAALLRKVRPLAARVRAHVENDGTPHLYWESK